MRATGFSSSCCGSYSTMTLSNLKGGLLTVTPDNRLSTVDAIFKGPSEEGHMREYYLPITLSLFNVIKQFQIKQGHLLLYVMIYTLTFRDMFMCGDIKTRQLGEAFFSNKNKAVRFWLYMYFNGLSPNGL